IAGSFSDLDVRYPVSRSAACASALACSGVGVVATPTMLPRTWYAFWPAALGGPAQATHLFERHKSVTQAGPIEFGLDTYSGPRRAQPRRHLPRRNGLRRRPDRRPALGSASDPLRRPQGYGARWRSACPTTALGAPPSASTPGPPGRSGPWTEPKGSSSQRWLA